MTTVLSVPTTMRDVFLDVVAEAVDTDPRVALVLADISAASVPDLARRHPDRVVNVGIREQLMVGVAGGLALAGLRPVVHTYAPFLVERPFESLKLDLGHQDVGAVLVSIGASHDAAAAGRTHQAPGDVAALDTLPGWTVHVPGHPAEAEVALRTAIGGTGRHYVRLSEAVNADPHPTGRLTVLRRGTRGTVVAVGPTLDAVLDATTDLDVTVAYLATVRPFDGSGLRAAVSAVPDVVLVEPYLAGTSSAAVTAALTDRPHRLLALGVGRDEHRRYGTPLDHDAAHGLDTAGLARSVRTFLTSTSYSS